MQNAALFLSDRLVRTNDTAGDGEKNLKLYWTKRQFLDLIVSHRKQ